MRRGHTTRAAIAAFCLVMATACGGTADDGDVAGTDPPPTPAPATAPITAPPPTTDFGALGAELDELRELLRIPGMSAAVVVDRQVVWAAGFGEADVANAVPATADTPYHLASVTKPIAATMLMQLVEEGLLGLDDPVADFGVDLGHAGEVEVWHLLTHTSSGTPGTVHVYDGDRYAHLGTVAEGATGASFDDLMFDRIVEPAEMHDTAGGPPGCDEIPTGSSRELQDQRVHAEMTRPYQLDLDHHVIESAHPSGYSPAAGLIASVTDIAAFDIALDDGELVSPETREDMFAPRITTVAGREDLAYGLGWYTQDHDGTRLVWHSGRWPPSVSALYLKVPDHDLTFIVLANTPNLTTPFPLGSGDVLSSALALAFYADVVYPRLHGAEAPTVDWSADEESLVSSLAAVDDREAQWLLQRELWARRQAVHSVGELEEFDRLDRVHRAAFPDATDLSTHIASAAAEPALAEAIEMSRDEMEAYVGSYELDTESSTWPAGIGDPPDAVWIELRDGVLVTCAGDSPMEALVPIGDDRFQSVGGPTGSFVIVARVVDGTVTGFSAEIAPGIELVFRRADP